MKLAELTELVIDLIKELKDNGKFPKENNLIDYKMKLSIKLDVDAINNFLSNFAKDILSFSNGDGGIILIGISEDKNTGAFDDTGLDEENLSLLKKIDLNLVSQQFEKLTKVGVSIDLQQFQISTRKFYYLLIEKQTNILVPISDSPDLKIKKGDILYRASGKNEIANVSTSDFNRFLQVKANEKSKEFMEIWSKLLPEMVDINPREVLIINPITNKIYGFNGKDNILSSSEIEIDKSEESGVFNIILNAISAGEIGKITTNEGKPLYKIVGEIRNTSARNSISQSTLLVEVRKRSNYKCSSVHLKTAMRYLDWVTDEKFEVNNPSVDVINTEYKEFLWIETIDQIKGAKKVVFSENAIEKLANLVSDNSLHNSIFGRALDKMKG